MVNGGPESRADQRAAARIHAARYILLAAAAILVAAIIFFELPALYAIPAFFALVIVAALPARSRAALRAAQQGRSALQVWPDTGMKATVEAFPTPAFLLDSAGTVRYANEQAGRLFPATRPGDSFTLTFRRPDFAEALELAGAGQSNAIEFRDTGAASNVYSVMHSPLRSPGGGVGFILVTFDDVSDRLAVARMRSDFVANASHELRTPLASLTGFVETLLGPARNDPAASEKFLRVMLDQARRMRRLIDDLLSLSRVEMRVHTRPTDHVDLVGVVKHVGDAMQPLAAENGVALTLDMPAAPVEVVGDRDELVQVMQNLIENAIGYGASGKSVEVAMELRAAPGAPAAAAISVRDHGPGIAPEHIPRLTERFYRVDVGASRERKGTGLGLAIVKHILTRHQGRLEIASTSGEGATFTVILPLPPSADAFIKAE